MCASAVFSRGALSLLAIAVVSVGIAQVSRGYQPAMLWLPIQFVAVPAMPVQTDGLTTGAGYGPISMREADRAVAYAKARDSAYAQALANLTISVQGVEVSHQLSVNDYGSPSKSTTIATNGRLDNVTMISERVVTLAGSPAVEIVLGARSASSPAAVKAPEPPRQSVPNGYTSVIIDCRGQGLQPMMSPKIFASNGDEIWGTMDVDPEFVIAHGIAAYARSMAEAKALSRTGANPLVLRAVGTAGANRGSAVLSNTDARVLMAADQSSGFLQACRVIFVID